MQLNELQHALRTVIAVPVTPFDADGAIDLAAFRQVIRRLIDGGLSVVTPNGNTGEFYALSPAECRDTVTAAVESAAGQARVVAGVGYDIATAIDMAQFARQAGADAVMVHQLIHPYRSAEGWIDYHRAIADAVPELGIVPYIRDNQVNAAMLKALIQACPNVVGIKYAVSEPLLFAGLVQQVGADRVAWVCGIAEAWAPFFWVAGAHGFTSGLVNVDTALSLKLLHCLQANDMAGAMQVWARLRPFEDLRARRSNANNVSVIKEAMAQLDLCGRTVRPPISELPEAERLEVAAILATWEIAMPARVV